MTKWRDMISEGCRINGGNWFATPSFGYAPRRSLTQVKERLRGTKIRIFSTHVHATFGPFPLRNVCGEEHLPVDNRKRRPQIAKSAVDKCLVASMTSKSPGSDLYLCGKTSSDRKETSHLAESALGPAPSQRCGRQQRYRSATRSPFFFPFFRRCSYGRSTALR